MYQFSRSIYRELAGDVIEDVPGSPCANRQRFLEACESSLKRLVSDRHYFAKPTRFLFNEVRAYFPIRDQIRVYQVIDRYMSLATAFVDLRAQEGLTLDGVPLSCHATTRKGTACQRVPLPGSKYCPSHKHLEEDLVEQDLTAGRELAAEQDLTATAA